MKLETFEDPERLAARAAELVASSLARRIALTGTAHLAVSGGGTPERTYEVLGRDRRLERVELWFVDERCVAPDDPDSNYRMVERTLLADGRIDAGSVHRMRGELGPHEGASAYADELNGALGEHPGLDVAILGIGPDGHTASLFPHAPALREHAAVVGVEDSPKPPPARISLSLAVLRAVRMPVMLVTGAEKSAALAAAVGDPSEACPASLLERERLVVLADAAAAAGLPRGDAI